MDVLTGTPMQEVMNEIQYFIALSVLKKLWKQGCIPPAGVRESECCYCRKVRGLEVPDSVGLVMDKHKKLW